jgi:transposase
MSTMEEESKKEELKKYKTGRLFREGFKVSVITDLVTDQESDTFVARKHGLSSGFMSTLKKEELAKHGYFRILEQMKKDGKKGESGEDLASENAKLRKALELATLKVAALETLIDVAEDQLNIDIRKKSGTKQSK